MVSFSGRVPSADAPRETFRSRPRRPAADDGASAVLAGTLAAAEALHVIVREASGPFAPQIRHLRLPLDGREPLVQEIGAGGAMSTTPTSSAARGCASPRRSPTSSATRRSCGCTRSSATRRASRSGPSASSSTRAARSRIAPPTR